MAPSCERGMRRIRPVQRGGDKDSNLPGDSTSEDEQLPGISNGATRGVVLFLLVFPALRGSLSGDLLASFGRHAFCLALPPIHPSATAAAFLPSSALTPSTSPVAIF